DLVGYNPFSKVDYSVPVNYWIRFDDKAQGIHDASWQGSFGGNVYQSNWSLGCINTPIAAVEVIYNNVDYGTPVIVFYSNKNKIITEQSHLRLCLLRMLLVCTENMYLYEC